MVSVKKNFIYLSMYKLFEMLLPMITSPILSRRLGATSLGIYTFNYSIVSMFVVVAELGCYRYGLREIAKVRDDKDRLQQTYSDIFFTHFFNGLIVLLFYLAMMLLSEENHNIYYIIMVGFLISNMIDNSFLFVGIEKIGPLSIRDGMVKTITFVLIFLLVKKPTDLLIYTFIMVFGTLICKIVSLIYSQRFVKLKLPIIENCKMHYKPMAILMIPALAAVIYQSLDKIMIGWFYNNEDVGYYECASKALIPRNIISALGTVLCPRIANEYSSNNLDEAKKWIKLSFITSMIMSYAFSFGISAIANIFAPWFWGKEFDVCSKMLVGLSVTIPLWTIGEVIRNQYLLPIGKDYDYTISFGIGVALNIVANLLLIPKFGAMGAIVATIIAEFVMSAVQMWLVRKEIPVLKYLLQTIPYLFIALIMFILVKEIEINLTIDPGFKVVIESFFGTFIFVILSCIYEKMSNKYFLLTLIITKLKR